MVLDIGEVPIGFMKEVDKGRKFFSAISKLDLVVTVERKGNFGMRMANMPYRIKRAAVQAMDQGLNTITVPMVKDNLSGPKPLKVESKGTLKGMVKAKAQLDGDSIIGKVWMESGGNKFLRMLSFVFEKGTKIFWIPKTKKPYFPKPPLKAMTWEGAEERYGKKFFRVVQAHKAKITKRPYLSPAVQESMPLVIESVRERVLEELKK